VTTGALPHISLGAAYRLRWKRRRCLWRGLRARRQLSPVVDNTHRVGARDILVVVVLRNERQRLPFFLQHYRALGAGHFLIVDNGSEDGSLAYLQAQSDHGDISLWQTWDSYRGSRFGLDWSGWLLMRYGHRRWCLTVDADELLVYPGMAQHDLPALTTYLAQQGHPGFGALMLDLFPKGPLGTQRHGAGQDPTETLGWFDAGPYRMQRQPPQGNLWLQGGTRDRVFFAGQPERAPTLNKIPLLYWNRRYAYSNSTHALLPRDLNLLYDGPGETRPSGVLLHSKFLPEVVENASREQRRGEHFHRPPQFDDYYAAIGQRPDLWHAGATLYRDPEQLADLGLCSRIRW